MNSNQAQNIILVCGVYNILLALFHLGFWKMFRWNSELKKLSFANRGIMQILNIQIILYFLITAVFCFTFPYEIATTKFGNYFLISNSIFWFVRTIQQFIFLKVNHFKIHFLTIIFFMNSVLFLIHVILKN